MLSFMLPDVFTPPVVAAFAASTPNQASERQVRRVRQLLASPNPDPDPDPDPDPNPNPAQVRRVRQLLAPFVLRRTKADVLPQMAGKVETERLLEMSPAQQRLVTLDRRRRTHREEGAQEAVDLRPSGHARADAAPLTDGQPQP